MTPPNRSVREAARGWADHIFGDVKGDRLIVDREALQEIALLGFNHAIERLRSEEARKCNPTSFGRAWEKYTCDEWANWLESQLENPKEQE